MRPDLPIRVATALGTTTDTPIGAPTAARSWARHSLAASAANFDTLYGAVNGVAHRPAIETVFTMWAGRCACDHPRDERADAVQDPPEVDAERPLEVAHRPLPDQAAREHAGVVAEDVDLAERREGVVGERDDILEAR